MIDLCALCLATVTEGPAKLQRKDDGDPQGWPHIGWGEAVDRLMRGEPVRINERVTDGAAVTTVRGTRVCARCVSEALDSRRGRLAWLGRS